MANNTTALGRRSQEQSDRTREVILDEAERLFSQFGMAVSIREIAKAAGVRHHTLQHHFRNKENLYAEVLCRWDKVLEQRLIESLKGKDRLGDFIDISIDILFDFLLEKRNWVSLSSRMSLNAPSHKTRHRQKEWVKYIEAMFNEAVFGPLKLDVRLLLITVEGITHNHVLAKEHYLSLYGVDITEDAALKDKTKKHIQTVVRSLMGLDTN